MVFCLYFSLSFQSCVFDLRVAWDNWEVSYRDEVSYLRQLGF